MIWTLLAPGIELAVVPSPEKPALGTGEVVVVVRVDPGLTRVDVAEQRDTTVKATLEDRGWVAAINAGMFEPGGRATFELRAGGPADNPVRKASAGAFLVAGPAGAKLLDSGCDDVSRIEATWPIVVQGFRVRACTGKVPWPDGSKVWSQSVLANDHQGRLLLVHTRSPWSVAAMARILTELPLDLDRVQYLEGGPESSLAVRTPDGVREWYGSYETGFYESDGNDHAWVVPNVIGVSSRSGP